jgi:polar amino acid transport system ATP-binding protein
MIKIEHLTKRFGPLIVLKDINLEISAGEVISVIGPSGTGKSTLLRCMNLLDRPEGAGLISMGPTSWRRGPTFRKSAGK